MGKNLTIGHVSDAISPTESITSIITAFCDSFWHCPLVFVCLFLYCTNLTILLLQENPLVKTTKPLVNMPRHVQKLETNQEHMLWTCIQR